MSRFSDTLTDLLSKYGISDDKMGELVGVNRTTVTRWRTGDRSPKMEKLPEIAGVFHVDPRIFVEPLNEEHDILNIYSRLEKDRQAKVFSFAQEQLEDQHTSKIKTFSNKQETTQDHDFDTLAAHAINPDKEYSPEEVQFIKDHLDKLSDEYDRKHSK